MADSILNVFFTHGGPLYCLPTPKLTLRMSLGGKQTETTINKKGREPYERHHTHKLSISTSPSATHTQGKISPSLVKPKGSST